MNQPAGNPSPSRSTSSSPRSTRARPKGRFSRLRVIAAWVLLGMYYVLPWINQGQQIVLFDLVNRQFHFFGITLWPQDLFILSLLLAMAALALFFFTALAGRLWCGYACPQTVWTEVFLWMERVTEGSRNKRMKLDKGPWTREKLARKSAKQFLWITFALWTGFTFVGFFVPIRDLGPAHSGLRTRRLGNLLAVLLCLCHLRQCRLPARAGVQVHVPVRALPVGHVRRQQPGHLLRCRARRAARFAPARCRLQGNGPGRLHRLQACVQVCPTGIDIRDGLQIECIACASCIDVCDEVMDKMGYPRGLIRYTTENALNKQAHAHPASAHLHLPVRAAGAGHPGRGDPDRARAADRRCAARPHGLVPGGRRRAGERLQPQADQPLDRDHALSIEATACRASAWSSRPDRWRSSRARPWIAADHRAADGRGRPRHAADDDYRHR
jgi:polyferredoxin